MIPLPSKPQIIKKEGNTVVFEISGLYPRYGITIGNSLRRILLSSMGGAAITQVKIKGVLHEFSTIPGVMEDVVQIILNLKKLRFKLYSDEPQDILLVVKGEKIAAAKDFKLTSEVEAKNPESHIATLTKSSAELNIEAKVEKGIGYEPAEAREIKKSEVGVLPIDAIYTPIKRVSTRVENMRIGKKTDFDKLIIEVETDGTMTPEEAFKKSSEILLSHFTLLSEAFTESIEKSKKAVKKEDKKEIKKEDKKAPAKKEAAQPKKVKVKVKKSTK